MHFGRTRCTVVDWNSRISYSEFIRAKKTHRQVRHSTFSELSMLRFSRYENHDEIDHQKMKLSKSDEYKLNLYQRSKIRTKSYLEFGHYGLLMLAELAVIVYTLI